MWWRAAELLCVQLCEDRFCLKTVRLRAKWGRLNEKRKQICGRDSDLFVVLERISLKMIKQLVLRCWIKRIAVVPTYPSIHADYLWSDSAVQSESQTCRGQCLFYTTASESGHNWACMVQVRAKSVASPQRWLHTFHSFMKPFNDSTLNRTHARIHFPTVHGPW